MDFKLKKPITSPLGVKQTFTSITMRDLTADDLIEGFAGAEKWAKQIKIMVIRCSGLCGEEIGLLSAGDYMRLSNHITSQIADGEPDPKE